MKSMKPKVQYDPEAKILSIRLSREKSVDSDVYGNVVADYGKNGKLVGVDLMDISLGEFKRSPVVRRLVASAAA